jgi:hypothetical protein
VTIEKSKPELQSASELADDDDDFFSGEHHVHTQISHQGWVVLKINIDRDVLEFIKSHWPVHFVNSINQVLLSYMSGKLKVIIPVKEYSSDRVKVVGMYDPELVAWIKQKPNPDGFVSLILRDFMQSASTTEDFLP